MVHLDEAIGHRGLAAVAVENTLASIRAAAERGFRWVEVDVRLTRDGVPVVAHDDKQILYDGGAFHLSRVDAAELSGLRIISPRYPDLAGEGEPVPLLEEVLRLIHTLDLGLVLELKAEKGREAVLCVAIARLLQEAVLERLIVVSFSRTALTEMRRQLPDVPLGLNVVDIPDDWRELPARGIANLHVSHRALAGVDIAPFTRAGLVIYAYTVNDAALKARLLSAGVAGVFTDMPI